jgi:DNA-binding IclR family transcriptional regulator
VAQAQLAAELRTAPVTVVAQRYGLPPSTVNVWRQKWGIPRYTFRLARRGGRDMTHYLEALAAQPEGVSASQLATRLHLTRQGIHWMLAKLEAEGYVHKRRPERDSQAFVWSLTDAGLQRMTSTQ